MDDRPPKLSLFLLTLALCLVAACDDGDKPSKSSVSAPSPVIRERMAPQTRKTTLVSAADADVEPNNSPQQAHALSWGEGEVLSFSGVLAGGRADVDHFKIPVLAGNDLASIRVTPKSPAHDLSIQIGGVEGLREAINLGPAGVAEHLPNAALRGRPLILQIAGEGEQDIAYHVEVTPDRSSHALPEPDSDEAHANIIAPEQTVMGWLNHSEDSDWIAIRHIDGDAPLDVSITPPGTAAIELTLQHRGEVFWTVQVEDGQAQRFEGLRPSAEPYLLRVRSTRAVVQPLAYSVRAQRRRLNKGALAEYEPNDTGEQPQALSLKDTLTLTGSLSTPTDNDHYRVKIPVSGETSPRILTLKVIPKNKNLDLVLKSSVVEHAEDQQHDDGRVGEAEAICNMRIDDAVTIDLQVSAKPPKDAARAVNAEPYTIKATLRAAGAEEIEPNPIGAVATALPVGAPMRGYIHPIGDVDVYRFEVPESVGPRPVRSSIETSAGYPANLKIVLKDEEMNDISRRDHALVGEAERLPVDLVPGTYYALISSNALASCTRPYEIKVNVPGVTAASAAPGDALPTALPPTPPSDAQPPTQPLEPPGDALSPTQPLEPPGDALPPTQPPPTETTPGDGSVPRVAPKNPLLDDGF